MLKSSPLLCLSALACALLASGCSPRSSSIEMEELRADNERLTSEIMALSRENIILAEQRDKARDENRRLRGHLAGYEQQFKQISSSSLPAGTYAIDGGVAMGHDFAFKTASAELNTEAVASLRELAALLNSSEYTDTMIIVEGHTDNTPVVRAETKSRFGDNWGLSAMRAAAVVSALQEAGIDSKRIRGSFMGEYRPRSSNATADGKAANRRVEIYLQLPAGG